MARPRILACRSPGPEQGQQVVIVGKAARLMGHRYSTCPAIGAAPPAGANVRASASPMAMLIPSLPAH
jgi:hypothetical protein